MDCEVYCGKQSPKAKRILGAMCDAGRAEGINVHKRAQYTGQYPWFMTWGPGHAQRRVWVDRHIANGGHVIAWDLAYWDRKQKFRLTIDHDHPHKLFRDMPETRPAGVALRDDYNPDGHIVIVGMGRKSLSVYDGAKDWERRAILRATRAYPRHKVIVRPKGLATPIQDALRGASLVVCRHSNVAIDACIAGIPVVCEDGIGFALYNNDITNPINPPQEARRRFLNNVAWWQWSPSEAREAWRFIKDTLNA